MDPALGTGPHSLASVLPRALFITYFSFGPDYALTVRKNFPAPELDVRVVLLAEHWAELLPTQTGALRAQPSARLTCPGTGSPPSPAPGGRELLKAGDRKLFKAGDRDGLLFSITGRERDLGNVHHHLGW